MIKQVGVELALELINMPCGSIIHIDNDNQIILKTNNNNNNNSNDGIDGNSISNNVQ